MYWILAALFIVIALAAPRLRPFGIAGLVILAALLGWGVLQRMQGGDAPAEFTQRGRPSSPASSLATVPLEQVGAENLRLSGGGAPFELSGAIENRADDIRLRSVTIHVVRRDCYEGALDPSGCVLVWQNRQWLPITVPPNERREFSTSIWMHGSAPRPRGEIRNSFELVAAAGERVQQNGDADE